MGNTKQIAGLALSGGGFRAVLFHLGVIRFLFEQQLLKNLKIVSSVSGGSILAAHLVLNWTKYNGTECSFNCAAREIIRFTKTDIRSRIIRRSLMYLLYLVPWLICKLRRISTRNLQLERSYKILFGAARLTGLLKDPKSPAPDQAPELPVPALHIMAASLTTGEPCAFSGKGFRRCGSGTAENPYDPWLGENLRVSWAVTASSSYPIIFPPVRIDAKALECAKDAFTTHHYLTDGGVVDNSGIQELLRLAAERSLDNCFLLKSDAGRRFDSPIQRRWWHVFYRGQRAVSMLMQTIKTLNGRRNENPAAAGLAESPGNSGNGITIIDLDIKSEIDKTNYNHALDSNIQKAASQVMTDLDGLSDGDVAALIDRGYEVAWQSWKMTGATLRQPQKKWNPLSLPENRNPGNLDASPFFLYRVLNILVAPTDLAWWALMPAAFGWLWLSVYLLRQLLAGMGIAE